MQSDKLGPTIGSETIAGLIIVYFLIVGFMPGLLLPSHFMRGYFASSTSLD